MGANELSVLLWRERNLLELLTYKLEVEQLLLTSGKTQYIQLATHEVEQVMEQVRLAGLARAVQVSAVGVEWGIGEGATLRELAAGAPVGPWGEILTQHLAAMQGQATKIADLRDANEQFLRAASRSAQETSASLQHESATYDAKGFTGASQTVSPRIIDRIA